MEALQIISRIRSKDELVQKIKHQFANEKESWWESICRFEPSHENKNALLVWTGGGSCYHENMSDEEIAKGCTEVMSRFLKRTDIPEPKRVFSSNWNSKPLFKGSYSYLAVSSTEKDHFNLAEPIRVENVCLSFV